MVVCTPAAAVCKSLVQSMIKCVDYARDILRVSCVHIVQGAPVNDFLDETDSHLAGSVVELVITHQRRSGDRTVRQTLDSIFLEMTVHAPHQCVRCILHAWIAALCPFVHSLFYLSKHVFLQLVHFENLRCRVLLPFPEAAPLPHVPFKIPVVLRNELVRSYLVVEFCLGKCHPVDVDRSFFCGLRNFHDHTRCVSNPFLGLFVAIMSVR